MSQIPTVRSRVSELQNRISKEASTLSKFESRIETTTARDLRLIQSALQGVIGAIHKRLLSDSPQNPKLTVATLDRENTLTRANYGNPWLQEIPDNITDRLDAAVELTSAAFDHVSHFSAEAAEYRGLNLVPLRQDVEAAHISIKQLQVIMEQRLRTVQKEQADIETNLRQKQGDLTQLRSVIAENERTIGIKQSEVRSLLAEGDRLRRAAQQQRSEMAATTVGGWIAAGFLTVICPPAGIAVAVGTTVGAVAGFSAADEKESAARRRQDEGNTLREHTQTLRKRSSDFEKEANSLSSDCSRHRAEISATYSELSSVRTSQSTYNGFQQQIGTFSQRTSELDDRNRALRGLLGQLKSKMSGASLRLRERQNQAWTVELADEQRELITGLSDVAKTLESCYEA